MIYWSIKQTKKYVYFFWIIFIALNDQRHQTCGWRRFKDVASGFCLIYFQCGDAVIIASIFPTIRSRNSWLRKSQETAQKKLKLCWQFFLHALMRSYFNNFFFFWEIQERVAFQFLTILIYSNGSLSNVQKINIENEWSRRHKEWNKRRNFFINF